MSLSLKICPLCFLVMLQNFAYYARYYAPNMPQNFCTNAYHVALWLSKEMQIRLHWISGLIFERPQCFHDRFYARARTAGHSYNTHKNSRILCGNKKCTNIDMQYSVHHFSSESLVQSSDTYNRQEAVYTRTSGWHWCMYVRLSR